MKTIAFFNSRSGVGKSFLAYHLAFMFQRLGLRVVVADIDPQMNLTSAFFDDQKIGDLSGARPRKTILGAIEAATRGGLAEIHVEDAEGIGLLAGDSALAGWEDRFSQAWYESLNDEPHEATDALRTTATFHTIADKLRESGNTDVLLLDLSSALGAINRAALLAADAVVIPLAPDLATWIALPILGKTLYDWREQWNDRRRIQQATQIRLPSGTMPTIGYVVLQWAAIRRRETSRSVEARAVADEFHKHISRDIAPAGSDPSCLAWLRHLRGLLELQFEARKPVFDLKAADGALGSYAVAVKDAYVAFENLAREIAKRTGIALPDRD